VQQHTKGVVDMDFVANFILFLTVKEF